VPVRGERLSPFQTPANAFDARPARSCLWGCSSCGRACRCKTHSSLPTCDQRALTVLRPAPCSRRRRQRQRATAFAGCEWLVSTNDDAYINCPVLRASLRCLPPRGKWLLGPTYRYDAVDRYSTHAPRTRGAQAHRPLHLAPARHWPFALALAPPRARSPAPLHPSTHATWCP
jgi:hypothetical protein